MSVPTAFRYRAFLSYAHADVANAKWLHRQIESFRIGKDLAGRETPRGRVPESLRPIFRDREDFTGGESLADATMAALEESAALIVLCSSVAATRPAVNEEVRLFRWRHPERPVIPVVLDGTYPDNFPPALRFEISADGIVTDRPVTILGPDLREAADGKALGLAKVVAGLIGVATDEVARRAERDRQRRLRNWVAGLAAVVVVLAGLTAWAVLSQQEAVAQRNVAEHSLREQAAANARLSESVTEAGDTEAAMQLALQGLPRNVEKPERKIMPEAVAALGYALDRDRLAGTLEGHRNGVVYTRFDSQGDRLVTVAYDDTALLWDAKSLTLVRKLDNEGPAAHAAFSTDGSKLVTLSKKRARVWHGRTGEHLYDTAEHGNFVNRAEFTPDGRYLVTAGADNRTSIWNAATGSHVKTLENPGWEDASIEREGRFGVADGIVRAMMTAQFKTFGGMGELAITPDSRFVVTAGRHDPDATPRLWDLESGRQVRVFSGLRGGFTIQFFDIAVSVDGTRVIGAAASDNTARVWNVATGDPIAVLRGHTAAVQTARFNPQGNRIVTASQDGTARLWDGAGRPITILQGHKGRVSFARFSPDGNLVVTGSEDKTARLWDGRTGALIEILAGHTGAVFSGDFTADGRFVATGSADRTTRLWRAESRRPNRAISLAKDSEPGPSRRQNRQGTIALAPRQERAVIGSDDDRPDRTPLRLVHTLSGAVIEQLDGFGALFVDDGRKVLTGNMRLWASDTGRLVATMRGKDRQLDAARRLLVANDAGRLRVYDLTRGVETLNLAPEGEIRAWHLAPSGAIVVVLNGSRLSFWSTQTGNRLADFAAPSGRVTKLDFDSRSVRVALATDERKVWMFGLDPPRSIELEGQAGEGEPAFAFGPDGKLLRVATSDGIRVWRTTDGRLVRHFASAEIVGRTALGTGDVREVALDAFAPLAKGAGDRESFDFAHSVFTSQGLVLLEKNGTLWRIAGDQVSSHRLPVAGTASHDGASWIDHAFVSPDGRHLVIRSVRTANGSPAWYLWTGGQQLIPLASELGRAGPYGSDGSGWRFVGDNQLIEISPTAARLFDKGSGQVLQTLAKLTEQSGGAPVRRRIRRDGDGPAALRVLAENDRLLVISGGIARLVSTVGAEIAVIGSPERRVHSAWLDNRFVVAQMTDGSHGFWRAEDGAAISSVAAVADIAGSASARDALEGILPLRFLPAGGRAIDAKGRLIDLATGKVDVDKVLAFDRSSNRIVSRATPAPRVPRPRRGKPETLGSRPNAATTENLELRDASSLSLIAEIPITLGPVAWTTAMAVALPVVSREAGLAVTKADAGDAAHVVSLRDGSMAAKLPGQGAMLATAAIHAGGKLIATGDDEGTVRVWRMGETVPAQTLKWSAAGIASLTFDQSGGRLITVARNGAARLWGTEHGNSMLDIPPGADGAVRAGFNSSGSRLLVEGREAARLVDGVSGTEIARITLPPSDVLSFARSDDASRARVAFSTDGRWLYSPWTSRPPRLWRADTGKPIAVALPQAEHDSPLQFDGDGNFLVYRSGEGIVRVDLSGDVRAQVLTEIAADRGTALSLSPRGHRLAVVDSDGAISVWDPVVPKKIVTMKGRAPRAGFMSGHRAWMSPEARYLVVGGEQSAAVLYDAGTGDEIMRLDDHRGGIRSAEFLDGERSLLTRDDKGNWLLWSLTDKKLVMAHRLSEHLLRRVLPVATEAGLRAVVFGYLEAPELIDLANGNKLAEIGPKLGEKDERTQGFARELEEEVDRITAVALLSGGRLVAVGSAKGNVEVWDAETKAPVMRTSATVPGAIADIEPVRADRFLTVTASGIATLWEAGKMAPLGVLEHQQSSVHGVMVNAGGSRILLRHDAGKQAKRRGEEAEPLTLWDADTGDHVSTLEEHRRELTAVGFSPDGRWLATGGDDGRVHVWAAVNGQPAKEGFARHRSKISALAWSPDSRLVLSIAHEVEAQSRSPAAELAAVQLRELATGKTLISLSNAGAEVTTAAFSANGSMIVFGASDGTIRVLDSSTGRLMLDRRVQARVEQAIFIDADHQFAAAHGDGQLRSWNAPTTSWRRLKELAEKRLLPSGGGPHSRELTGEQHRK